MICPQPLRSDEPFGPWSCRGTEIWDTFRAAADGDTQRLADLLARDPDLYRAEYWYTQPIHFAVREGRLEAVRLLLSAGADPGWASPGGDDLMTTARDRGHAAVADVLAEATARKTRLRGRAGKAAPSAAHQAAATGDAPRLRALLDAEPDLLQAPDEEGRSLLHRAVAAASVDTVRLLLELGADPSRPEGPGAPRGTALHLAARNGDEELVRLLLAHGADPNATIDSAGSATFAARTSELRTLLIDHGGALEPYDLVFLGEDEEALRRVRSDPRSADAGCGGVLAAAAKLGKRRLVERLLKAGARVPAHLTACRSYLWCDPGILGLLLASGLDPNLPDWHRATPLHSLCERDGRGRARPHRIECAELFLDAGASLSPRDDDYRSTPLGWAARNGLADMVELLIARGAPVELPDDPPWARPLAWARRRGHHAIAEKLLAAGATEKR